ncbi:FecR family protein [Chitinophaga sp. MM2321]|uniref:FecR family protein n=1 Tax=Chitinophaga sp. MM2321 TaxID=3137178 RepID=UPI0032D5721A
MDNTRLAWLFNRYRTQMDTVAEREEFLSLVEQTENEAQLQQLLTNAWHEFQPEASLLDETDSNNMWQHIRTTAMLPLPRRRVLWPYFAAAASLLFLIAIGSYFVIHQEAASPAQYSHHKNPDILPGSNKAVLTLANGDIVQLDSTGNQVIAQGGINIQQHNGQLQYTGNTTTATIAYNTLTTPRGGKFQLVLPDGSKVWLNSASSLKYPAAFNGKERVVELQGQGYFEIAADAQHPFKVKVNDMEVQVLGTHFDIMAYEDENTINTTLLEGGVKVVKGITGKVLKPGEQAIAATHTADIAVQTTDVNRVIAWKNDRFIFNDLDLETILREISRWYDVEIVYKKIPGKEKYSGGLSRNLPLSVVLQLLEENNNNHFDLEGRRIIVMP